MSSALRGARRWTLAPRRSCCQQTVIACVLSTRPSPPPRARRPSCGCTAPLIGSAWPWHPKSLAAEAALLAATKTCWCLMPRQRLLGARSAASRWPSQLALGNFAREACVPPQVLRRYPMPPLPPPGGARTEMAVSMLQACGGALNPPHGDSSTGGRILSTSGQRLTSGVEKPRARSHWRAMTTSFTA